MAIEITQSIADELIKIEKEFESREIVFRAPESMYLKISSPSTVSISLVTN